jgi:DMSO/TMAO reductase YedYZ molybdopterin-dependent catalytic subunit
MDERETDKREMAGLEKPIGRRAFIGLMVAGLAALFLGKPLFSALFGRVSSSTGDMGFRINSVGGTPEFDEATWRLTFDGLFRKPATLTFSEFTDLPQATRTKDFYCVEGWGVTGVAWQGVTMTEIMKRFDIDPSATHIILHSGDTAGYTDSVTIAEASRDDTLLAHRLNGQPLPPEMGRPLRLVLPGNYGYKYVKWVVRVEAVTLGQQGYLGYWEGYGYPADATIGK